MTPQEEAKRIYKRFFRTTPQPYHIETVQNIQFNEWDKNWTQKMAVEQSIICVEEITVHSDKKEYWAEVLKCIKNLQIQ